MSSFPFIEKEEYCQNLGNFGHYPGWPVLKGCRHGWIPAHQSCNQSKTVAWGRLEEQGLVPSQLLVSFKFQCFVPDSWQWSTSKTQKKCFKLRTRQQRPQFLQYDSIKVGGFKKACKALRCDSVIPENITRTLIHSLPAVSEIWLNISGRIQTPRVRSVSGPFGLF